MRHPWSSQHFTTEARRIGRDPAVIKNAVTAAQRIKAVHRDLPVILTLKHLAHLTDTPFIRLRTLVGRRIDAYRVFRLKKRSNPQGVAPSRRYRTICIPDPALMRVQRWIAQNILKLGNVHQASVAYAPGSDIVEAAARHCGCRWLVKMDAQKFFESITETQVYFTFRELGYGPLISFELARLCTRLDPSAPRRKAPWFHSNPRGVSFYMNSQLGHLPQGAPTSPMLANLAVRRLDERLARLAKGKGFIYTRYADDFMFSTTLGLSRDAAARLANRVEQEMKSFGLEANRQKTKIASPGARKIVLGLLVDRERPRLTRAFRDNLETHVFALTHPDIGPLRHQARRGFASVIGLRRHVEGLLNYAHHVDAEWAEALQGRLKQVAWPA